MNIYEHIEFLSNLELQSLEVAKYVWFLLKEIGVSNIPSLAKIRNMKFGKLDAQNLIVKVIFNYMV